MDDPVTLTVLIKGVGMLVAFGIAYITLKYGYRLYRDGAGAGRDKIAVEAGPIKASAHSIGSVMMVTAFVWGFVGLTLSPKIDRQGENVKVVFQTPEVAVSTYSLSGPINAKEAANDSKSLITAFQRAARKKSITVNGEAAQIETDKVTVEKTPAGEYQVTAPASTNAGTLKVIFDPEIHRSTVTFSPVEVRSILNVPYKGSAQMPSQQQHTPYKAGARQGEPVSQKDSATVEAPGSNTESRESGSDSQATDSPPR